MNPVMVAARVASRIGHALSVNRKAVMLSFGTAAIVVVMMFALPTPASPSASELNARTCSMNESGAYVARRGAAASTTFRQIVDYVLGCPPEPRLQRPNPGAAHHQLAL